MLYNVQETVKDKDIEYNSKDSPFLHLGIEIEGFLLNGKGQPLDASTLIEESLNTEYPLDYEYANCQFEFKTDPLLFYDLTKINDLTLDFLESLDDLLIKAYPNQYVIPVFLGANPSKIFSDKIITDKPRMKKLSKWWSTYPDVQMEGQAFRSDLIYTAIQGFHFHLQGKNSKYAINIFNHILNLIPSSILLSANSKIFAGRTSSLYEPRLFLSDHAELQNSGFPKISKYLDSIQEYVDYVFSHPPVIASNYYELEKERHDDVRIRIMDASYRVETRVSSVQPTIRESLSMIEFFIGYLHRAISEQIQLKPLANIKEERKSVIESGFNEKRNLDLITNTKNKLDLAKDGLYDLNINPQFLDVLYKRLENKSSIGEVVSNIWDKKYNGSFEETTVEVVSEVWEHTKRNKPLI